MRYATRVLLGAIALIGTAAQAQFRDTGFEVGILGGTTYDNSTGAEDIQPGITARLSLAAPLLSFVQWEIGGGYTELRDRNVHSVLTPGDLILKISPVWTPGFIPYIFGGGGVLYYRYDKFPSNLAPGTERNGYVAYVPAGVGAQLRISGVTQLELRGSYTQVFSPDVSPAATREDDDGYFSVMAGVRFSAGGGNPDRDNDGLSNRDERRLGTDPRNPDSDGDSLTDGDEHVARYTNPLNADSDDDRLRDGAEVNQYNTNPLQADTDEDGLADGLEVLAHRTDPRVSDTDADGLGDEQEVNTTRTDPNRADTDSDALSDGLEVNQYKTDPLKIDTDQGTIADGLEVERGSDPLNGEDDVPEPVMIFEMNRPVVLPGIQFRFNSAEILPESEAVLIQAYTSLADNPEVVVEIGGHTDAVGSDSYNQKLSQRRAESVRQWMVNKGIAASRLNAVGYGESKPVASNDTDEGRAQNRRIEFTRIR